MSKNPQIDLTTYTPVTLIPPTSAYFHQKSDEIHLRNLV